MQLQYDEALAYLLGFTDWRQPVTHRPEAIHNPSRMRCLLDLLGAPDASLRAAVIAGTKGKGSTAAILAACLRVAGYRAGLYSQPHLHDYRERVRVDGQLLAPAALIRLVARLQATVPQLATRCPAFGQPSTYDLGTALAILHFAERQVDYAVLEVGLGGRLDSVNTVIPLVSAITAISLDHTAVLGERIEQIAAEKAGIIKPGVPVVTQPQPADAWAVLARTAAERGAPLYWVDEVVRVEPAARLDPLTGHQAVSVTVQTGFPRADSPARSFSATLALLGPVQRDNAATALAAFLLLTADTGQHGDEVLAAGLATARWPGRLEIVRQTPLTIVDGAHNAASARQLRRALAELFPDRPRTLVLGTSVDKDIAGIVRELASSAARVLVTESTHPRSVARARLRDAFARYGVPVDSMPTVGAALDRALAEATPDSLICVTGSLFVVADAREHLGLGAEPLSI